MNLRAPAPVSPTSLARSLWGHRELIFQMTKRDVNGRYKGSVMGLIWSFANPILLLAMYTSVFSVVFKARWGVGEPESRAQFAVLLFVGMIVHSLFSEILLRAISLNLANVSYVKKSSFPLKSFPSWLWALPCFMLWPACWCSQAKMRKVLFTTDEVFA